MLQLGVSSRSWMPFVLPAILAFSPGTASAAAPEVRFASGRSALKIPFRMFNNHIYLHVAVNGSAPLWFVLDTGARHIIARKHANALGLKLTPAGQAGGIGEQTQDAFTTEDVSLALPGVTVTQQRFGVIDFANLEDCSNELDVDAEGRLAKRQRSRTGTERQPFDGVLGDEFFRRFVVEIDYAARVMNLYDPGSYRYDGRGEAIPLDVRSRSPFVRTQLTSPNAGNVMGLFMIDTGNMSALVLSRPFVESNNLLPPENESTPFEVCGIGGGSMSRMGRLESLRLGSRDVRSPVTLFSQARTGNLAGSDYDGLIGNAILRRFKVIFDYSRSRMILEDLRPAGVE